MRNPDLTTLRFPFYNLAQGDEGRAKAKLDFVYHVRREEVGGWLPDTIKITGPIALTQVFIGEVAQLMAEFPSHVPPEILRGLMFAPARVPVGTTIAVTIRAERDFRNASIEVSGAPFYAPRAVASS